MPKALRSATIPASIPNPTAIPAGTAHGSATFTDTTCTCWPLLTVRTTYRCIHDIKISPDGIPICSCGKKMKHDGFDHSQKRHKWKCPTFIHRNFQLLFSKFNDYPLSIPRDYIIAVMFKVYEHDGYSPLNALGSLAIVSRTGRPIALRPWLSPGLPLSLLAYSFPFYIKRYNNL